VAGSDLPCAAVASRTDQAAPPCRLLTPQCCELRWVALARRLAAPGPTVLGEAPGCGVLARLSVLRNETEHLQSGDAVVAADLLGDQSVLALQQRGAGEAHRLARARRQCPDGHVVEGVAAVGATALPIARRRSRLRRSARRWPRRRDWEGISELRGESRTCHGHGRGVQRVLKADHQIRGADPVSCR
jgi:hypothetical protein